MNRKERRNLQRQGVQVPKDPTLNIKLSALGKSIMTPELGADVEQWQKEVLANEPQTLGKR